MIIGIKSWLRNFDKNGLAGLKNRIKNLAKSKLNSDQKEQIKLWLKKNPDLTMNVIRLKIAEQFGVSMSLVVPENIQILFLPHIVQNLIRLKDYGDLLRTILLRIRCLKH